MGLGLALARSGRWPAAATKSALRRMLKRRLRRQAAAIEEWALGRMPFLEATSKASLELVQQGAAMGLAQPKGALGRCLEEPQVAALVLGPNMLEFSSRWERGEKQLDLAEELMLDGLIERAGVEDGMAVHDVDCGWGGLALELAKRFPNSRIVATAATPERAAYVAERARSGGFDHLAVEDASAVPEAELPRFDRIFAIECFDRLWDYRPELARLAGTLTDSGRLLVQLACHRCFSYRLDATESRWLGRQWGGDRLVPSATLLPELVATGALTPVLKLIEHWEYSGEHYERTARAWIQRLDQHREAVLEALARDTGPAAAARAYREWRLSLMALREMFGFRRGQEWWISQYVLARRETG